MRNWLILAIMSLFCLGSGADPAGAKEAKFELRKITVNLPEFPPTEAYTLETDDYELTFIPPHESQLRFNQANQEVKFKFRDDRCLITLRHSEVSPALASQAGWNKLREIIQERHPDAEVSEGCACLNSCGAGGCSFTIRRRTGFGDLMLITRLSFIPVEGGTVEVSMTANGSKFATEEFVFRNFLNCLRIEKSNPPKAGLANN